MCKQAIPQYIIVPRTKKDPKIWGQRYNGEAHVNRHASGAKSSVVAGGDPGITVYGYLITNPFRISQKTYSGPEPRPLSVCFCCPSPPGIHHTN